MRRGHLGLALAAAAAVGAAPARASGLEAGIGWREVALFAGGAAAGFALHETGHLAANLALGNVPRLERETFAGVVPFFSVAPGIGCAGDRCFRRDGTDFGPGRRGFFTILVAGFHVQHLGDEVLLTREPALRLADAPFRKGLLAFNTLTSVAYVVADWAGFEPGGGDLRGVWRDAGGPRHAVNALVLGAAVLDLARFAWPEQRWLAWASRATKLGLGGVTFAI